MMTVLVIMSNSWPMCNISSPKSRLSILVCLSVFFLWKAWVWG